MTARATVTAVTMLGAQFPAPAATLGTHAAPGGSLPPPPAPCLRSKRCGGGGGGGEGGDGADEGVGEEFMWSEKGVRERIR